MPGSESMNELGKNNDEFIKLDTKRFEEVFYKITFGCAVSSKNCVLAMHYAYGLVLGQDLSEKKVVLYHIHTNEYIKYLWRDFRDMKLIVSIRDSRANVRKREANSIVKANEVKFRKSDNMLMSLRAYRQVIKLITSGLDKLSFMPLENVRVFRHEDLVLRLESLMENVSLFLGITYNESMLNPTWGSLVWRASFYTFDKQYAVNPDVIKRNWLLEESYDDLYVYEGFSCDYLNAYKYPPLFAYKDGISGLTILFFKLWRISDIEKKRIKKLFELEGMREYFNALMDEVKNIQKLISYKHNLFYSLKWTNDGVDYSKKMFYEYFLDASNLFNDIKLLSILAFRLSQISYVLHGVLRYMYSFARIPYEILLRNCYICIAVKRRLYNKRYFPEIF